MILSSNTRIARRRLKHECFLCELPIQKGDVYVSEGRVYEGKAYTLNQHELCRDTARDLEWEEWEQGDLVTHHALDYESTPEWSRWYGPKIALRWLHRGLTDRFVCRTLTTLVRKEFNL
jgi:hypothetical protein